MMKKILSLLLALILVFSLAACGGSGSAGNPGTSNPGTSDPGTSNPGTSDPSTGSEPEEWTLRTDKMVKGELNGTPSKTVTISTSLGDIKGVQQNGYKEFRGVRYATAERFEDPVLVTGWTGTYDATKWGNSCWQYSGLYGVADSTVTQFYMNEAIELIDAGHSEDCLNLNIYTPDNAENCPVLVYIHGGSHLTGSNTDTSTDGEAYAHHGVITVSINYRLGPYQSFYGDGYTGYMALKDQATAVKWVHEHIADFGGDPSRITIMGESAGAASVQNLLITPLLEDGIISGAIMMSGGGDLSSTGNPSNTLINETAWNNLKKNVGVDSIADLKDLTALELYTQWLKVGGSAKPMINGDCLTGNVTDAIKNGTVKNVPVIIGMLSEDMYPYTLYTSAVSYGKDRAKAGGEPVYLYYFDRQVDAKFGAFHAADLYYIFGTLHRNVRTFDEVDYRIADNMIDYVANFCKTGDPNGEGLAQWTPVTSTEAKFMNFGDNECAMVEPDTSLLSTNQQTKYTFPFADKIETNKDPEKPADKYDLTEVKKASKEDLLGTWDYVALHKNGEWTVMNSTFDITEDTFTYTSYSSAISFEGNVMNILDWGCTMTCWYNAKGQLVIYDSRDMYYICEGDPVYDTEMVKDASKADLLGTWNYIALHKNGAWTEMSGTFDITEDTFYYSSYSSAITFEGNVMNILDWFCTMTCGYNAAGQLVIYDSRDMYYILESDKPVYDTKPVKDAVKEDLLGVWNYKALYKNGAWTEMSGTFEITETTFYYSSYSSAITFEGNVMNILDWFCTMTCGYNAAGQLVIYDSRDMYYILESDKPVEEPVATEKYDLAEVKAATKEDLIGTWNYIALKAAGAWTELDDTFVITENTFTYSSYSSAISFDGNVMNILDWFCTMTCWFNAEGQLVIYDSRDMYYILDAAQ